jgi:hypothetical protein
MQTNPYDGDLGLFCQIFTFKVIWEQIFKNQNRVKFRIFLNVQMWEMVCGVVGKAPFMI